MKKYLIGILIGATLMFSAQSFAAIGDKVEAVFANFNFIVNGHAKEIQATPIVINGSSYLPVKDISNMLGYDVTYKADSRTIELTMPTPTATPTPTASPIQTQTPTPTPTPAPSQTIELNQIKTVADLQKYFEQNFSKLHTNYGDTEFKFQVEENNTTIFDYDYRIKVDYNGSFFYYLKYDNKLSEEDRNASIVQLRDLMVKIYDVAIGSLPNKKFTGSYYSSYYEYPYSKVGFVSINYFAWTNYDETIFDYNKTKPSSFRWSQYSDEF